MLSTVFFIVHFPIEQSIVSRLVAILPSEMQNASWLLCSTAWQCDEWVSVVFPWFRMSWAGKLVTWGKNQATSAWISASAPSVINFIEISSQLGNGDKLSYPELYTMALLYSHSCVASGCKASQRCHSVLWKFGAITVKWCSYSYPSIVQITSKLSAMTAK